LSLASYGNEQKISVTKAFLGVINNLHWEAYLSCRYFSDHYRKIFTDRSHTKSCSLSRIIL